MSFALLNLDDFSLVNLDSYTIDKTTNEAYHEINNNTLNKSNIKEVTTDITDIQNGNRIKGRDYKLDNHYNAGHESFGLQLQNLGFLGDLTGAVGGAADLTGAVWGAVDKKDYEKHGKGIVGGIS